ncbi:hypothetical protein [Pseudoalteromonas piscicida]|uniref:hypothetical protein n=1 Tax=Pseudoalteromonas piscicida TaxID=43662 RepID=UPI0032C0411D
MRASAIWRALLIGILCYQPAMASQVDTLQQLLERVERVKAKLAIQQSERVVSRVDVGTELFLSAYKGNLYLGEVIAVTSEQGVNVELLSLFSALGFVVSEDVSGTFDGWFFTPENTFSLNAKALLVESKGQRTQLSDKDVQVINGEVFLADYIVATLFDVRLFTDIQDLSLTVKSRQILPIEAQQQRLGREVVSFDRNASATLPWRSSPYQSIGKPVLDAQINAQVTEDISQMSYSLVGSQDIAYWQAQYFIAGREGDVINRSRLSLNRASKKADVLPFGNFTKVSLGDVQSIQVGVDALNEEGRGVSFSNAPLDRRTNRQRIVISGPVQVGWDVELYRNGLLIGQENNVQSGRYEFENIDLLFGENTFELVMYGGQGQVSKEVQTYYVEQSTTNEDEGFFAVSITETGKSILGDKTAASGKSSWQVNGRFDYGLTTDFAVYAGFQHRQGVKNSASEQYFSTGFNTNINKRLLLDVDYSKSELNQRLSANTRTRLFGQQVGAKVELKEDLERDENATEIKLTAAGDWSLFDAAKIYYRAEYFQLNRANIDTTEQASLLFSTGNYWGTFSNQFVWQEQTNQASDVSGYLRWQRRIFGIYSRFTTWYDIKPSNEITAAELELSKELSPELDFGITLYKDLAADYYKTELGLSWNHDKFRLLTDLQYDNDDNWQLGLSGQVSIGAGETVDQVFLTGKRLSQFGSLMVRAFIDQNNNGYLDDGELPLKGVTIKALQNFAQGKTDDDGVALLPAMVNYKRTDIIVDKETIPEPFLIPANDGFSFTPRPGHIEYVEIPFVNSSEVEGIVEINEGTERRPAGFTTVSLLDETGNEVARTQTAYDGYYVFTGLKPGTYRTAISDAKRLAVASTQQIEVELSAEGGLLLDVNHELQRQRATTQEFAVAGRFKTLTILKVYAAILAKRYPAFLSGGFGYAQKEGDATYLLILRDDATQNAANICQNLLPFKVSCTVEALTIYERENNAIN